MSKTKVYKHDKYQLFLYMDPATVARLEEIAEQESMRTGLPIKKAGLGSKIITDWVNNYAPGQ